MPALDGQIALVTGASRGIGRAVALMLARKGAHVIALARNVGELESLDDAIKALGQKKGATLVPLDMKDHAAIDRLAASIQSRWGVLDILAGNAAVLGPITPVEHITPQKFQELLDVNLTANWRLIRALAPLLRASNAGGRAVFVSSGAAQGAKPFWGGYSMSKAALESLVKIWAAENAGTGLRINLFNPGATRTGMRATAMPGEDPMTLPAPELVAEAMLPWLLPDCSATGRTVNFRKDAGRCG
ncbi:MAG: SDR family NAD(P)-dependent oxidoreductase [Alphaproteobacteria bacterium]|nr:SDR family NAD(P)-dependent oxidoreductase [Alphaproteobacteria bacterium]